MGGKGIGPGGNGQNGGQQPMFGSPSGGGGSNVRPGWDNNQPLYTGGGGAAGDPGSHEQNEFLPHTYSAPSWFNSGKYMYGFGSPQSYNSAPNQGASGHNSGIAGGLMNLFHAANNMSQPSGSQNITTPWSNPGGMSSNNQQQGQLLQQLTAMTNRTR